MVSSLKSTEEQVIRRKYHLYLSQSQRSDERVSKNSKSTGPGPIQVVYFALSREETK